MKKFLIIFSIFIFIILIAIIGSVLVSPNNQVEIVEDILVTQTKLDSDYSCYGYTVDNPKIVTNPYDNANLSALMMFTTEEDEKIEVYLHKKDGTKYKLYEEDTARKDHYLDIYGMYANYENKVTLVVDSKKYEYTITTVLDIDFPVVEEDIEENNIYFQEFNNSLIGYNSEKEIVYYFQGFTSQIKQLENGHLLVTDNRKNNDGTYISFSEIDMLGRVYNTYTIEDGYKGIIEEFENSHYLVLSDNILQIDRQNGKVFREFRVDIDDEWIDLEYNKDNNEVILYGKKNILYYNFDNLELTDTVDNSEYSIDNNIQINTGNYFKQFKQNRFGNNKETEKEKKNANLLIYSKLEDEIKLDIKQEFDRIVVNKESDDEIILILDKLTDRRSYKINIKLFYINNTGLSGKYSIYVKLANKLYKTNYYIEF